MDGKINWISSILLWISVFTIVYVQSFRWNTEESVLLREKRKTVSKCGEDHHASHGVFKTPYYPSRYHVFLDCAWHITVPIGHHIQLTFSDINVIDYQYGKCNNRHIEVFEVDQRQNLVSLEKLCEAFNITTFSSTGNEMVVKFYVDTWTTRMAFTGSWKSVSDCGGVIHGEDGVIQSYDYPEFYPNNLDCSWDLVAPSGDYEMELTFDKVFDIEDGKNCGNDYVEVFSLVGNSSQSLGRFCGHKSPVTQRGSSRMKIVFHSNQRFDGRGFSLSWKANRISP